jgi:RNA polymerase sigma factor (sigma-70 family)
MTSTEQIFDQLLILNYQSGDQKSLSLLVHRWQPKLMGRVYNLTKNSEVSHDIVQDAWASIVKNLHKLNDPAKFSSWAFTIANRKTYDWIKFAQKNRAVFSTESELEQPINVSTIQNDNSVEHIKAVIKTFTTDEQLLLNLFYLENYSLKKISTFINTPVGTVKSKLFYLREKLKLMVQKGGCND